jgi:hypothetical protein
MSKNLTNIQLDIICNRIMSELRKHIITGKVYKDTCTMVAESINYDELKKKAKRYEEIQEKLKILGQEANLLSTEIKNPFDKFNYFTPDLKNLMLMYDKEVEKQLNEMLPKRSEIQSDIVLGSISGSKDIISEILKKYI